MMKAIPSIILISNANFVYFLLLLVAPSSSVSPTSLTVDEGANAEFNCTASGTMTTQRWVRGEDTLSSTDQLVLQSVTRSSAGSYMCEVFGQYGGVHRSTATLNVNCE